MQKYDQKGPETMRKIWSLHDDDTLPFVVQQLYTQGRRSLAFLLLVTLIAGILLSQDDAVPPIPVVSWVLAIVLTVLFRLLYAKRVQKRIVGSEPSYDRARHYYKVFFIGAVVTAALVGSSVPLFLPYLKDHFFQFTLIIYVIGIAAGAMAALFPSLLLATTYAALTTLPLAFYFFSFPDLYARVDAAALIFLIVTLTSIAQVSRRYMLQVYRQRKELLSKEAELQALFLQTPTPIFYFDPQLRVRKFNETFRNFFEIPDDVDLEGFDLTQIQAKELVSLMREVIETGEPRTYDGRYLATFTPREYWLYVNIAPLKNDRGEIIGAITSFQDRTLEVENIEYLEELATLDPLTELGNRRSFHQHLHQTVTEQQEGDPLSLLYYLDLNQFKPVNDTLGHHFGDQVLKEVAKLLRSLAPREATVFRLGGDEFVILHPKCCRTEEEARQRGADFAHTVDERLSKELVIDKYHLSMHASIGIVMITPRMRNSDEITRRADVSMYQAKRQRRPYAFYDSSMDENRRKNFFLKQGMAREDFPQQLELHYQPIYSLECQKPVGAEALLRWRHPKLGLLMPNEFIPLAIESGEVFKIGAWIREEVCRMLAEIQRRGKSLDFISVNVDAQELGYEEFMPHLNTTFETYDIDPGQLVLEITENSLIDNFERHNKLFDEVKKMGIRWAIDDFGVGYSSLSYLQRLAFSILKIDRSFIEPLENDSKASFLVSHIVEIASRLGYQIVAEGVEVGAQQRKLQEIQADIKCQGYLFNPPLRRDRFFELLSSKEG
jgi:diguanylate cyclase (GGDEF)-like protein